MKISFVKLLINATLNEMIKHNNCRCKYHYTCTCTILRMPVQEFILTQHGKIEN